MDRTRDPSLVMAVYGGCDESTLIGEALPTKRSARRGADKGWRFPQKRHHDGMHPIAIPKTKHERKDIASNEMGNAWLGKQGAVICNINHLPAEDGV
jgi:hypothetical protein